MTSLAIAFLSALALAVASTYGVRALASRFGIVDHPDGERRLHQQPTPRIGGVAVYAAFSVVLVTAALLSDGLRPSSGVPRVPLALAGTGIFAIGLWDDLRGLTARVKFALESGIAGALCFSGVGIHAVSILGRGSVPLPPSLSFLVTVLWIVGITNALNLLDGADGVAAGSAVFAAAALGAVSLIAGHAAGALAAFTLAGVTLGFLFFNFPPASIFLGDCGSLFIGFTLAIVGLVTAQTASTMMAVAIPVVSLGLPILDTLLAIARRFLRGERIFNPDQGHIHHRLRDLGHSPRKVTLLLYAACAGSALLSLLLVHPQGEVIGIAFLLAGVITWVAVQRLDVPELLELRRIVRRGLIQRTAIAHNVRVREAVRRLRAASDAPAMIAALEHALEGGEFGRAELWVEDDLALPLVQSRLIVRHDRGFIWRWGGEPSHDGGTWEFRLVVPDEAGRAIGRLSLWHDVNSDHVLTDLQLIGSELQPALRTALRRAHHRWENNQAAARVAVGAYLGQSYPRLELDSAD